MYNYTFNEEKIIYERHDIFIEINNQELFVNILISDKNILLFTKDNEMAHLKGNGVFYTPEFNLLTKISLNDISFTCTNNITYINNIVIYDFNLNDVINELK